MAYKYKTDVVNGGHIQFNISPDLYEGGAVAAGDRITFTGIVRNAPWGKSDRMRLEMNIVGTDRTQSQEILHGSSNESDKSFTTTFVVPDFVSNYGSGRVVQLYFRFLVYITDTSHYDIAFLNNTKINYVKYRLEPNILDFRLERCNSSGAADNEGTYLRCAMLKLSKSARAGVSDYSVCRFSWNTESGETGSFSASGPFSQALTGSGYKETGSPGGNLFGTRRFLTTTDYNVTLTVGDAYDTCSATVVVPRAFAILHLSGAANGGVAVGMFSSATDSQPKFEVAESHRSIFYGPVEFQGAVTGVSTGGSIVGFTTATVENTSSSNRVVSGTIPTIPGANSYICTGVLGWNSGGRSGYAAAPTIAGNALTVSLAGNSTIMFGILGIS